MSELADVKAESFCIFTLMYERIHGHQTGANRQRQRQRARTRERERDKFYKPNLVVNQLNIFRLPGRNENEKSLKKTTLPSPFPSLSRAVRLTSPSLIRAESARQFKESDQRLLLPIRSPSPFPPSLPPSFPRQRNSLPQPLAPSLKAAAFVGE